MMDTAVSAMAKPMSVFLTNASGINRRAGDAGCSSKAVKTHAEIMKIPSSALSIRYSGQCRANAWPAVRASDAPFSRAGKVALRLPCVAGPGEMCMSVTRDRIRMGAISDSDRQEKLGSAEADVDRNFLKILATFWKLLHPIGIRE